MTWADLAPQFGRAERVNAFSRFAWLNFARFVMREEVIDGLPERCLPRGSLFQQNFQFVIRLEVAADRKRHRAILHIGIELGELVIEVAKRRLKSFETVSDRLAGKPKVGSEDPAVRPEFDFCHPSELLESVRELAPATDSGLRRLGRICNICTVCTFSWAEMGPF